MLTLNKQDVKHKNTKHMSISDESTIIKKNEVPMDKNQKESSSNDISWSSVVIGGVPGILLGSTGSLFAANRKDEAAEIQDVEKPNDEVAELKEEVSVLKEEVSALREELASHEADSHSTHIGYTVNVAHGVSDSMSFSEAFATARAEIGPAGVFTWHGNVYSTYYENEWENMSDAQKHEYAQAVHNTDYHDYSSGGQTYHGVSNDGDEIHVLSQEEVEMEDGQMVNVTRVEVDGHYGEVYDFDHDGQPDAALLDSDDDGQPDVALVDDNGDGMIDGSEVYQFNTGIVDVDNDLYGDMPDYTNDADPSSFV